MLKYISDYSEQQAEAITEELRKQSEFAFNKQIEATFGLSKFNVATNAGGAVALLTYIGTGNSVSGSSIPLVLFVLGLVASGIEMRAVQFLYSDIRAEFSKKLLGFTEGASPAQFQVLPNPVSGKWQKWASWISQALFVSGALAGVLIHVCYAP